MEHKYLSANNVSLTEETQESCTDQGVMVIIPMGWTATHSGASVNEELGWAGPLVEMTRTGSTAKEAYENLMGALLAQGWELR